MLQELKLLIVLLFEDNTVIAAHTQYFLPKVEIKDYIFIIDGKSLLDQSVKNDLTTNDKIQKIAADYTTGFLLDYPYFKKKL